MTIPRILSVGSDYILMSSRPLLLRRAGYNVEEAQSVAKAIILVAEDSIDLTLICHTISKQDQQLLVAAVREKRRLMPVLCIRSYAYEIAPYTCIAVDNEPVELLDAVRLATKSPMPDSTAQNE
jgi:DNA-binding NtrC family response regulator